MAESLLAKLTENIRRQGDYPPLIVRPHPRERNAFQVLDGHQRLEALGRLDITSAHCYVWPCSDAEALVLIATLNRLHGEDQPAKRADLLEELAGIFSLEELGALLPEDEGQITRSLSMHDVDLDEILRDLTESAGPDRALVSVTFALAAEDADQVETAVRQVSSQLTGSNRRGRALGVIASAYLEADR
jgi:ParB-like chromosome segregation protein Spo0J